MSRYVSLSSFFRKDFCHKRMHLAPCLFFLDRRYHYHHRLGQNCFTMLFVQVIIAAHVIEAEIIVVVAVASSSFPR